MVDDWKKKILEFINNLSKTQKIILLLVAIVILIFIVNFMSTLTLKETFIDYKNSKAVDLIAEKEIVQDRDLYLTLSTISENFLNTYIGKYKVNNKVIKLRNYYDDVLFDEYKYNRSFGKFKKAANGLYKKIFVNGKSNDIPLDEIVSNIYVYSEARKMYIVEMNTNVDEKAYIGIKLDDVNNIYYIFYVE